LRGLFQRNKVDLIGVLLPIDDLLVSQIESRHSGDYNSWLAHNATQYRKQNRSILLPQDTLLRLRRREVQQYFHLKRLGEFGFDQSATCRDTLVRVNDLIWPDRKGQILFAAARPRLKIPMEEQTRSRASRMIQSTW
jgi:hypothetical protein